MKRDDASDALRKLHERIDARAAEIALRHSERLHCERGCPSCCVDDLTVFPIEAERIRSSHAALLRDEIPHPPGADEPESPRNSGMKGPSASH